MQNSVPVYVEDSKAGPPAGTPNLFSPPDADDIRTIYVPFESAVNVPSNFDIDVASSFGYSSGSNGSPSPTSSSSQSGYKFPNFPANSPSYDNPISSYDAPISNVNYNAKVIRKISRNH